MMRAFVLGLLAVGTQYLCSVGLILICVLAGFYLYALYTRKPDKHSAAEGPTEAEPPEEEPAEEPAEEEPVEEVSEEISEEISEEEDGEEIILPMIGTKPVRARYDRSFTAKLMQSSDETKQYYADLANELFSYDKVRNRISWANSSFYTGRKAIAKFSIRGKTLYLYLALDPADFADSKYFVTDESAMKRYEAVPLRMKIKSQRGVKYGKELIGLLLQQAGVTRSEDYAERVKPSDYPYDTTKNLLERGLIKLIIREGEMPKEADRPVRAEFETHEQVSAAEAEDLLSDEIAVSFIEEAEETVLSRPKGIINIDTLSDYFEANETVTLRALKEKKLIDSSVNHVKVLARGVLNKPLIVKMPEFSVDAVKMIVLTGGKAIKLTTKRK